MTAITRWPHITSTLGSARKRSQDEVRGLELLALNDDRLAGVVRQQRVIEFGDLLAARPIPELEDRADQPDPCHIVDEPRFRQYLERRRMRRRGARIFLRRRILIEQAYA